MTTIDKVSEYQEICSIDDQSDYEHIILGHQFGIGLRMRGRNDPHVCFHILSEDDGHWFVNEGGASTSWFSDLTSVIERAVTWCTTNCDADVSNTDRRQYGWIFKRGSFTGV